MPVSTHVLNVDFDVYAPYPLGPLARAMEECGALTLHSGRCEDSLIGRHGESSVLESRRGKGRMRTSCCSVRCRLQISDDLPVP